MRRHIGRTTEVFNVRVTPKFAQELRIDSVTENVNQGDMIELAYNFAKGSKQFKKWLQKQKSGLGSQEQAPKKSNKTSTKPTT
ncbi:hypothetical protein [Paludibacterium sp.]|uniref:hypothetical protein n=1 Tax=Paludibacterium sp. TaxID=1917523 RepID=UPI0026005BDE|nr:hypothetical protein [Paludibacterium sp.]MBV8649629.1 hypothetical protein [Paludibacterium sp.]